MTGTSRQTSYEAWTEHRHFKYRGCAPDPDHPGRAVGSPEAGGLGLPLDAWLGDDRDGAEPQDDREARKAAAIEVCLNCPVMVQCDVYANTVTPDGKLLEPSGIRGGRTSLERHRALIQARGAQGAAVAVPKPAPDRMLMTVQKQAVLAALAVCWEPAEVMERAELSDVGRRTGSAPRWCACWGCRRTRRGCGCWRWLGSGGFCRTWPWWRMTARCLRFRRRRRTSSGRWQGSGCCGRRSGRRLPAARHGFGCAGAAGCGAWCAGPVFAAGVRARGRSGGVVAAGGGAAWRAPCGASGGGRVVGGCRVSAEAPEATDAAARGGRLVGRRVRGAACGRRVGGSGGVGGDVPGRADSRRPAGDRGLPDQAPGRSVPGCGSGGGGCDLEAGAGGGVACGSGVGGAASASGSVGSDRGAVRGGRVCGDGPGGGPVAGSGGAGVEASGRLGGGAGSANCGVTSRTRDTRGRAWDSDQVNG
jgi:hypothetical protein